MKKALQNNWIMAIAINLVIMICIMLICDMAYETNDDYAISMRVAGGYPYVTFINWLLMKALIGMQSMMPGTNAFVLFQIVMGFVSFTVITWVMLEKSRDSQNRLWFMLLTVFAVALFSIDQYSVMQFTKSSAVMLIAGTLLLIHSFRDKRGAGYYVPAFVLIYCGFCLRFMNLFVAIGFAGVYLIFWVVINHKKLKAEGYLSGKMIGAFVISCLLLAGTAGLYQLNIGINSSTPELKEYVDFDYYRQYVCDYPIYESYEQNRAEFDEIGIDENDLFLMSNWYLDPDGAASTENLRAIYEIYADNADAKAISGVVKSFVKACVGDIRSMNHGGLHLILLALLALGGLIAYRPKYALYVIVIGLFTAAMYMYLYYLGRPAYRAFYIADLAGVIWLLYYPEEEFFRDSFAVERRGNILRPAAAVLTAAVIMAGMVCAGDTAASLRQAAEAGQMNAELASYIEQNSDCMFLFGRGQKGTSPYYAEPLSIPEGDYQDNALGFGSWGTDSPYIAERLEKHGMSNTFGDLIDNEKAFVIEDRNRERLVQYMNKWYGADAEITMVEAGSAGERQMWKFTGHSE